MIAQKASQVATSKPTHRYQKSSTFFHNKNSGSSSVLGSEEIKINMVVGSTGGSSNQPQQQTKKKSGRMGQHVHAKSMSNGNLFKVSTSENVKNQMRHAGEEELISTEMSSKQNTLPPE